MAEREDITHEAVLTVKAGHTLRLYPHIVVKDDKPFDMLDGGVVHVVGGITKQNLVRLQINSVEVYETPLEDVLLHCECRHAP